MVQINFAHKSVNLKVVYYGPGMSGKTTNLEIIHQRAPEGNRGDLTSISTDGDRTLFFDFMPLDLGTVAGMRTAFQLYTVPGQVYYNSTRKLVLQGVDGIIFVADSSAAMINQNLESLRNLEENLNEYGKSLATLPHVIQLNKRDLPDAMSVEELGRLMNTHNAPLFEAIANSGQGVFPTLKALAASVLKNIMSESGQKSAPYPAQAAAAPQPRPAAPARPQPAQPARAPQYQQPAPHHQPHPAMPAYGQPSYPQVGGQPAAGGGFFAGGPQGAANLGSMAPAPPMQGGLQLAQPQMPRGGQLSQTRSQPRPAAQPKQQHKPAPAPAPAAAPAPRPQRAGQQSHAKPRAAAKPQPAAEPPKSSRGKLTPVFIVAGVGVGAVLAWVLMNVL
ncbi:MAG: GTPase [Planctomycetes bacterium]|nr:GTPase [Planctomycetota bacterium]